MKHQQPPCDYEEKVKKISEKLIQSPHSGEPLNQTWNDLLKIFSATSSNNIQPNVVSIIVVSLVAQLVKNLPAV